MRYVEVRGARVPAVGLGTFGLRDRACVRLVRQALDLGYRYIDTAEEYGNEAAIGRGVQEAGVDRPEVFISTKVHRTNLAPEHVRRSCEQSLRRLCTEYIDLLLVHWPNPDIPMAETLGAFEVLKSEGKVRHIGVSNFTTTLMREALDVHGSDLLCNQVEYHVMLAQSHMLGFLRERGMLLTAYSPLAGGSSPNATRGMARRMRGRIAQTGRLPGRALLRVAREGLDLTRRFSRPFLPYHPVLVEIGRRHGKSGAQVALRWLVEQDQVNAVPRAETEAQLRENIDIFDFTLTPEDRQTIAALEGPFRVVNPDYAPVWDA